MSNARKTVTFRNGKTMTVPSYCAAVVAVVGNTRMVYTGNGFWMCAEVRREKIEDQRLCLHGQHGTFFRSIEDAEKYAARLRRSIERGSRPTLCNAYVVAAEPTLPGAQ